MTVGGSQAAVGNMVGIRVSLKVLAVAVLLLVLAIPSATATNRSGTLDPSFGTNGRVTVGFGWRQAEAEAMVSQPDGKIVAAGHSLTSESASRFTLARYNKTGMLDPTFGNAGRIRSGFGAGSNAGAFALVLEPDGKLVAAGEVGPVGAYDFALIRYNADGTLDRTFGAGGKVETDIGGDDHLAAVELQPDGKILGVGVSSHPPYSTFAVARYDPNGSLDVTFGTGGMVTTEFGSNARATDVVLQPDGKIIVVGRSQDATTESVALARYESNGALDQTFGSGGKVTTSLGHSSGGEAVVLQPDGRLVVGGYVRGSGNDFVLLRYDPTGGLDTTFGSDGRTTTDFGGWSDSIADLALQADGKIVATGNTDGEQFALARYDADGSLDRSFGNGGKVRTRFRAYICWATSLLLQKNGKIVVGGWVAFRYESFAIARYMP